MSKVVDRHGGNPFCFKSKKRQTNVDLKKQIKSFIYGHKHPNEVSVRVDVDWWAV